MNRRIVWIVAVFALSTSACSNSSGVPLADSEGDLAAVEEKPLSECWEHDLKEYRELAETLPADWKTPVEKAKTLFDKWLNALAKGNAREFERATLKVGWQGTQRVSDKVAILSGALAGNGRCELSDPPRCEEAAGLAYRDAYNNLSRTWRTHVNSLNDQWQLTQVASGQLVRPVESQAFEEATSALRKELAGIRKTLKRFEDDAAAAEQTAGEEDCSDVKASKVRTASLYPKEEREPRVLRSFDKLFSSVKGFEFEELRPEENQLVAEVVADMETQYGGLLEGITARQAILEGTPLDVVALVLKFETDYFDKYSRETMLQGESLGSGVTTNRMNLNGVSVYEMEAPFGTGFVFWAAENAMAIVVGVDDEATKITKSLAAYGQRR